ncbi:MAG TPA: hypothetical protein VGB53_07190 [Rubricoccaceae bacterium]|jgi:hypothetical protein
MSDKPPPRPAASYATLYPRLCSVARPLGYALALHGSMQRDMDVVAIPWVEDASEPEALVQALCECVGGAIGHYDDGEPPFPGPHGRLSWSIHFRTGGDDYIDLSVMPRQRS